MKLFYVVSLLLSPVFIFPSLAFGQNDSVPVKDLGEVVVDADLNHASSTATTYTPTAKQKNSSRDAVDLLRRMGIPEIVVPPSGGVTDNGGQPVSLYINYMPASSEELSGMRMADVKTVQYLEYPSDPRFQNAPRVINYIMHQYEYGGYTKLSQYDEILNGFYNSSSIFSRFAYKKMTYDLYAGSSNADRHHGGSFSEETYSLLNPDGTPYAVTRTLRPADSHDKTNSYPMTFRASYATPTIQIRNTLGFTYSSTKEATSGGSLFFSTDPTDVFSYSNSNPSRGNSLSYNGYYLFLLPRQWSISFTPQFSYTHSNVFTLYTTPLIEINRHARENAYYERLDLYLNKTFPGNHTGKINLTQGAYGNSLTYSGTDNYHEDLHQYFVAGSVMYNYNNDHFNIAADAGGILEIFDINHKRKYDPYPFAHINVRYTPNRKHTMSLWFQYASTSPGLSEKTPDILQSNEFLYITGDPDLNSSRHITTNLNYTWLPSNNFSLSAFANFFEHLDRFVNDYEHYLQGSALLRRYINDGNFIRSSIGISANWFIIPNKLQLYVSPRQNFFKATGLLAESYNPFSIYAQLYYYFGNFYAGGYYSSPSGTLTEYNQAIVKGRHNYQLSAGWGNASWNVQLNASNFFNKGWKEGESIINSPLYDALTINYGVGYHPCLSIFVSYTFGYGKRINRNNEVGGQSGASSAILR